jgi:hypothetical protein
MPRSEVLSVDLVNTPTTPRPMHASHKTGWGETLSEPWFEYRWWVVSPISTPLPVGSLQYIFFEGGFGKDISAL